jgi:hypothetical protein
MAVWKANGVRFAKLPFVTTKVNPKNPWCPVMVSMVLTDPCGDLVRLIQSMGFVFVNRKKCVIAKWEEKETLWKCTMCLGDSHIAEKCCGSQKCCWQCGKTRHGTIKHAAHCKVCQAAPLPAGQVCNHMHCLDCKSNGHTTLSLDCPKKSKYVRPTWGMDYLGHHKPAPAACTPTPQPALSQ